MSLLGKFTGKGNKGKGGKTPDPTTSVKVGDTKADQPESKVTPLETEVTPPETKPEETQNNETPAKDEKPAGVLVATDKAPYHKTGTVLTVPEHTAKKMLAAGHAEYIKLIE